MIRTAHPVKVNFLSLLLVYALLLSLLSPFTVRRADAALAEAGQPTASPASTFAKKARHRAGELIIRFSQSASEQDKNILVANQGARRDKKLRGKSRLEKLRLAAGRDPQTIAAELRRNPLVEVAEPNYLVERDEIVPNDPQFAEQWALRNTGQDGGQVGADISAALAWETTTGSPSTVIAVIDSGIDFTHPDLQHHQWTNPSEQANGVDDDQNGLVDDLHGWDWVAAGNQITDEQGHGTLMAGLIAAEGDNALGTTGVMWRASVMSLRVLDASGTGDVAQAVEAIDYAVAQGATAINCSWGTDGESSVLREAIVRAASRQVVVVASAGNGARDIDSAPYYPASYELPNVIAVAATNSSDQLASTSNWGATKVNIAAPGAHVLTTKMGGGLQTSSGTSASTAIVSGVVGLVRTMRPLLGAADTKAAILNGARGLAGLAGKVSAGGVVSASGALATMQGADVYPSATPTPTPTPDATPTPSPTPVDGDGSGDTGEADAEVGTPEPPGTPGPPRANLPDLEQARSLENVDPQTIVPIHADACVDCEPPPTSYPPVAVPGGPYGGATNQAIYFYGGGSYDEDGTITRHAWNFGDGTTATGVNQSHVYTQAGTYTVRLTVTDDTNKTGTATTTCTVTASPPGPGATPTPTPTPPPASTDPELSTPRTDPANETGQPGVDLGSRNYNWSMPLVSLPGRSGMDLGITLYLNSLVWVKEGNIIRFNTDQGFPSPGFRLGFPTIQHRYLNSEVNKWAYLLVTSSGGVVEMRQVGNTNLYESADSSYFQMTDNGASGAVVRAMDGTEMIFVLAPNGHMRCTRIMDRNGNYISATYTGTGKLSTVTDTLGRVLTFVYNASGLGAIRQQRTNDNGVVASYDWAKFYYDPVLVQPGFDSSLTVQGPINSTLNMLTEVRVADASTFKFEYTKYGQVWKISRVAPAGNLLSYTSYNLAGSALYAGPIQSDCPRFTEQRTWAKDWNNETDAVVKYTVAGDNSWTEVQMPNSTRYKELYAKTGWQKGLPTRSEVYKQGSASAVKVTTTTWTQDDEALSYRKNPRVEETNIYDFNDSGQQLNRRRTTFTYHPAASFNLVKDVKEYAAGGASVMRTTHYEYNLAAKFTNLRIIGLVSEQSLYKGDISAGVVAAKVTYEYDEGSGLLVYQSNPVQQDADYYTTNTTVRPRGNLTSVERWDATAPTDEAKVTKTNIAYNTCGSVIFTRDALLHKTTISYADLYYNGVNPNAPITNTRTLAYPTSVVDAEGYTSTAQYDFDTGEVRKTHTPSSGTGTSLTHLDQLMEYDSAGRLTRATNLNNQAYTKWVYPTTNLMVQQYRQIESGKGLAYSWQVMDGAGHVIGTASDLPSSTGLFTGQSMIYDVMGRMIRQSNPTEMDANWYPKGDDATGWRWTQHQYDWQGRPTVTTNQDNTTRTVSYDGCGCAGGEQTTLWDERGRSRRLTKDIAGRLSKVEEMNWDGTSVYATTTYTYDVLDNLTLVNQGGRQRKFSYDGYGRLESRITPEQGETTYIYNPDDTLSQTKDARGVTADILYSKRHEVKAIDYSVPVDPNISATPDLTYTYDAAGHRLSMTEAQFGSATYEYNDLGQMTTETRNFTEASLFVTLSYEYNLGGELTRLTNTKGPDVGYVYDKTGRVLKVTSSDLYAGVSEYVEAVDYRAFGGIKAMTYGNTKALSVSYDTRLRVKQWNVSGVLGWNYYYNYFGENTGRVTFADSLNDQTLDRSYDYDQAGRLISAYTGTVARNHVGLTTSWVADGPYMGIYSYDQWGNVTERQGWGVEGSQYVATLNAKNQLTKNPATGLAMTYDLAGNLKSDGTQVYTYDATGQQTEAKVGGVANLQQWYDGERLRVKKVEAGETTYYVRSSVLGGQVMSELKANGEMKRGYVYVGGQLIAIQDKTELDVEQVRWVHQDPVTKSQRFTTSTGAVESQRIDLDPWGTETNRTVDPTTPQQKVTHRFTTYERDNNGTDEAMHRRYNSVRTRFEQPDPWDGSYNLANPQSFNLYSYVRNDPVNQTDPSGLVDNWVFCDAQYGSCSGQGQGYGSNPFDYSYFRSAWGDANVSENIARGIMRYEDWKKEELRKKAEAMRLLAQVINSSSGGLSELLKGGSLLSFLHSQNTSQPSPEGFPCAPDVLAIFGGGQAVTSVLESTWELARRTNREEGGWIYMNRRGRLKAVAKNRAGAGDSQTAIDLSKPPDLRGWIVVGTFHTHDYNSEPSQTVPGFMMGDVDINNNIHKVPGIILGGTNSGNMAFTGYGPTRGYWKNDLPRRCRK